MHQSAKFQTELAVFSALCWSIGTPVAYKAFLRAKKCDWLALVSIKVRPADYVCAKTYLEDCQIASFFKKFPGFDLGIDLEKKAVDSFWSSEAQCYQTNERLSPLLWDLSHYGAGTKLLVGAWRKEVRQVLGRAPHLGSLLGKFGPGSTYLNIGNDITIAHKLSEDYTYTRQASQYLHLWDTTAWSRYAACGLDTIGDCEVAERDGQMLYQGDGSYAIREPSIVRGNRFTTVPKDATKLRGICVEPSINVFYQTAVGAAMSQRMSRTLGWDKVSCQDYHKSLARIGSITGAVATIDLSSASDTVCYNLVKLLLPSDWFRLVDGLRSSHTFLKGAWVKLEKFSSMGNGYTFELETLLFYTLARAVQKLEPVREDAFTPGLTTSVFGDDIIVPSSSAKTLVAALNYFGFKTNLDKTFLEGSFRESCGGDYFAGSDVRPHFQKVECEQPHQLIALANGLRRFGLRHHACGGDNAYRVAWFKCLDSLPRSIRRCRGPEALGDLVVNDDEHHWQQTNDLRVRNSIRYLRVWRPVPNRVIGWENWRPGVVLAAALYGASSGAPPITKTLVDSAEMWRRSGVVPRVNGSYVSGYRFGRVAYS